MVRPARALVWLLTALALLPGTFFGGGAMCASVGAPLLRTASPFAFHAAHHGHTPSPGAAHEGHEPGAPVERAGPVDCATATLCGVPELAPADPSGLSFVTLRAIRGSRPPEGPPRSVELALEPPPPRG